jgi:dolichol-phosphate mannosyltransferase
MSVIEEHKVAAATPALSVVVPCYNEQDSLATLYGRVTAVCASAVGQDYELVLIDDGSKDRTREKLRQLAGADPRVVAVLLSRNHGHQLALTAGLNICRGRRILILDADLQDPPELLPQMMALMDAGADVVYGQRISRQGETRFKTLTAAIFYRLFNKLISIDSPANTGDFRLMSRRALDTLNKMPETHRYIRGMVSWIGFKQVPLLYERDPRFAGETNYTLRKMVTLAVDAITSFSIAPLRMSMFLGFLCCMFGLFFLAWTAVSYFAGVAIQGWTTLMSVVLILGSGQLFVLGVMGEYLGRLYIQSKNRPLFTIEEIVTAEPVETGSRAEAREPVSV